MKNLTIISTEEFENETVLFMSDGSEVKFETSKLIEFIEKNKWNYEYQYAGNNSPRNDGDPCYDLEAHVEVMTPEEYLDLEFDHVCKSYYLFEVPKNK